MKKGEVARNVDEYIVSHPPEVRASLEKLRQAICEAAPLAEETISYMMPAYKCDGVLVYFGAYKNHIGFYPTGSGIAAFQQELTRFKTSKGTVQFPIDQPLPLSLIKKIVKYRVKENQQKKSLRLSKLQTR
jgi:uncharacterized protein YdhG (YjbR/CyaY superfamily)